MAINGIQFQKGLSLAQFMKEYGTEAQCEEALVAARWPHGFECAHCGHKLAYEFRRRELRYWQCKACRRQVSLRAGTMMENSKLPLTTWYLAIYLMTQSKTNITALAMMRQLGIGWNAAWLLKHKLMETMRQREEDRPLQGDVRVDDAYLGGERTGGKAGRGSENKIAFVAAVEMADGRPQRVRFDPVENFSFAALAPWAGLAIAPGSCVLSDGLLGFEVLERLGYKHKVVLAPKGKAGTEIEPFKWINVLLGNLKTALSGTHHAFKFRKYAHRYLAEVQYRFNRRFDLAAMVRRLAVAVTRAKPCSKRKILAPSASRT
ncbi:MAG: IS1595 family transposase [Pseudomonadota bacterium]